MFAHLDELYASSKDLMDEVCPTFMDHVGAWAEAVESGGAASAPAPTVSVSAEGSSGDDTRDVAEELTNAVFGFSIETKSETVKTMKELLQEVSTRCDSCAPQTSVSASWWLALLCASVNQAESSGVAVDPAISSVASELVAIEDGMARGACFVMGLILCVCVKRQPIVGAGAVDDVFAHLDELYASSKDLMDEVCPTFMDHVGAWAEAVESGAAAAESGAAAPTVSVSAEGSSGGAARDVAEELTNAVFGFSIETKSESVKTMKELLQEVSMRCDSCALWMSVSASSWLALLCASVNQAESSGVAVDPAISSVASELVAIEDGMARGAWFMFVLCCPMSHHHRRGRLLSIQALWTTCSRTWMSCTRRART